MRYFNWVQSIVSHLIDEFSNGDQTRLPPPLDLLEGFEAAARTLSFTRAASELNLTQSAISRQIATLEQSLGVALFIRRPRTVALTAAGRIPSETASRILSDVSETLHRLNARAQSDRVCLTMSTSFASLWLIPRLPRYALHWPHTDVLISATDAVLDLASPARPGRPLLPHGDCAARCTPAEQFRHAPGM